MARAAQSSGAARPARSAAAAKFATDKGCVFVKNDMVASLSEKDGTGAGGAGSCAAGVAETSSEDPLGIAFP